MKKKGFTLIELLAVIVILAIIALIATPAVLNIIEDSRKSAAEASARNIVNAAKTYYMSEIMNGRTVGTIDLSTNTLKYDGDQADKGYISFTDGKPESEMYIVGYCVQVSVDGKVTSVKMDEEDCEVAPAVKPVVYTKYNDGYALLYDPVRNVKCINTEVETNYNNYISNHKVEVWRSEVEDYIEVSSIIGLKDGCMKWYAFLDSEDSSTVNLILDHNSSENVAWNSDVDLATPDTVNAKLQDNIKNWNDAVKSTARLISASEINQIAPPNPNWSQTDISTSYDFHNGNKTFYEGAAGSNTYAWLFDNTRDCTTRGCNVADSGTWGYWTSSFSDISGAWYVSHVGRLNVDLIAYDENYGVRPVITVSKEVFK